MPRDQPPSPHKLGAHELRELLDARCRGLAPPADELPLSSRVRKLRVREDLLERRKGLSRLRRDRLRDVGRLIEQVVPRPGHGALGLSDLSLPRRLSKLLERPARVSVPGGKNRRLRLSGKS